MAFKSEAKSRRRLLRMERLEGRALLSLTHHYTFNGGDATDLAGNADGSLHNGATVVDGKVFLQNTGVSSGQSDTVQHVQFPAGLLPEAGSATVEVWYASANSPAWARVFDFGSQFAGQGDSFVYLSHHGGANDTQAAYRRSASAANVVSTDRSDDGYQHMAAVVIDGNARTLTLYLDGVEQATTSLGRGGDIGLIDDTLNYLGRSLFDNDPGFTGLIDELRVYDTALTAGEIAGHAAAGAEAVVIAGDYNFDGRVDDSDWTVWAGAYGSTSSLDADGNADGVVNAVDYVIWRDNFGTGIEAPADQVLSDESMTLTRLTDTVIELTGHAELHLEGGSRGGPLFNSEVRLNSDDALLFLENVKPTEANALYLSQVRVNSAAAVPGLNVRVVQYDHGTVVLPHAFDFQPLEAFTGPHFTGESATFEQYTYHDNESDLGVVAGDLSSFRLKRGYLATLATEPDGTGHSQVFVAQDHDIEVPLLPEGFDNEVRFLRVVPWRWVEKKGASDLHPETLDAAWFYNWNNSEDSTYDYEYVPIKQQLFWPGDPLDKTETTHWLGFNEPNNPVEDAYQSLGNGSVDAAIAFWPNMMRPGLRIGSPAVTDGGKAWLYEFMDKAIAQDLRVDYIAIHNYQANHSPASLQAWLKDVYDRYHLPIWITEFNNGANWTGSPPASQEQNAAVIGGFIDMMDNTPWIERYSIYSRVEAVRELTNPDGSLTPTGVVYHDNDSPIGFVQDLPGPTSSGVAQLSFEENTLDSSGSGYTGHTTGLPAYVDGVRGEALDFDGVDDRVQLPTGVATGDEFSFAGWVKWDGGANWQRVFDFGKDTDSYLFLTPSNGSNLRFAIKNHGAEQVVQSAPLAVGQWTHVAVTLGGGQAKLYVDGALVDTNNAATMRASDVAPTKNYLGDSQFPTDPRFSGQIDEVLITDYVLSATQIAGLMTGEAPNFDAAETEVAPATVGVAYAGSVAGLATDADGAVSFSKVRGPAWLSVAPSGALAGTPTADDLGTQHIVARATDTSGAVAYTVVSLRVEAAAPAATAAAFFGWTSSDAVSQPDNAIGLLIETLADTPSNEAARDALLLDANVTVRENAEGFESVRSHKAEERGESRLRSLERAFAERSIGYRSETRLGWSL